MNIIKKACVILVVGMLLPMCAGCRFNIAFEPGPYSGDHMELYTIAAFSIPFADQMGKGGN